MGDCHTGVTGHQGKSHRWRGDSDQVAEGQVSAGLPRRPSGAEQLILYPALYDGC